MRKAEKCQSEECNRRKRTQDLKGELAFQGEVDTWDRRKTSRLETGLRNGGKQVPIYHCRKLCCADISPPGWRVLLGGHALSEQTHFYQGGSGTGGSSTLTAVINTLSVPKHLSWTDCLCVSQVHCFQLSSQPVHTYPRYFCKVRQCTINCRCTFYSKKFLD